MPIMPASSKIAVAADNKLTLFVVSSKVRSSATNAGSAHAAITQTGDLGSLTVGIEWNVLSCCCVWGKSGLEDDGQTELGRIAASANPRPEDRQYPIEARTAPRGS